MEQVKKRKHRRTNEKVDAVEEVVSVHSQEVLESCDSCLADIDEILEEQESRELTDEEIYAEGRPRYDDYGHWDNRGVWVWDDGNREAYDTDLERYAQAYEAVTGTEFKPCGCGS